MKPNLMKYTPISVPRIRFNPTDLQIRNAELSVLRQDMQIIYSMACITLFQDYGWPQDKIIEFITATQNRWAEWAKKDKETRPHPLEMCEEITDIQLKGIWEAGDDNPKST